MSFGTSAARRLAGTSIEIVSYPIRLESLALSPEFADTIGIDVAGLRIASIGVYRPPSERPYMQRVSLSPSGEMPGLWVDVDGAP